MSDHVETDDEYARCIIDDAKKLISETEKQFNDHGYEIRYHSNDDEKSFSV
jgi:hypothetical protein